MEITEYNEFEAKITGLEDLCNFLPDATNDEGYEKSKRISLDVGKVLSALEKKRKEIKAPALERCKFIDSEAKELKSRIEMAQLPHKSAYKKIDDLKKQAETARLEHISERIKSLYTHCEDLRYSTSSEVGERITLLTEDEFLDCDEKTGFALIEKKRVLSELEALKDSLQKSELEKIELENLRKDQEARERKEEREAIAKKAADDARLAEKEKMEAIERSEQKAKAAAIAAEEEAKEANLREKIALENSAKEKIEAEAAAKKAAEDAEIAAKKAAADAVIAERKRSEEAKAAEIAEAAKREANKKHHATINNEALAGFVAGGLSEGDAKKAVELIAKSLIQNVSIRY